MEGKSNHAGIRFRDGAVKWKGLTLSAIIDFSDPVIAHTLRCRVKYVRLVRRKMRGQDRFYLQLICEGIPYQKPKHRIGSGEVGLDIGPSTVAAVGDGVAFLVPFCGEVVRDHRVIRRLQRKLDRQRRANNPQNFLPDGQVKPGPKRWAKSNRQRRTEDELANCVLAMGRVIKTEKLSYRAMQRQYGKSVGVRAPGRFLAILRRKAESAGGRVIEFPTRQTKLSQVCHGCGAVKKKPLSLRVHACECGVEMQRDLYSAFLARCVGEDGLLHADRARAAWSGA